MVPAARLLTRKVLLVGGIILGEKETSVNEPGGHTGTFPPCGAAQAVLGTTLACLSVGLISIPQQLLPGLCHSSSHCPAPWHSSAWHSPRQNNHSKNMESRWLGLEPTFKDLVHLPATSMDTFH